MPGTICRIVSAISSGLSRKPRLMARRVGADHGKMLYSGNGYANAWFMWHLQGDTDAAKAFTGENPELLTNPLYQDQKIDLDHGT